MLIAKHEGALSLRGNRSTQKQKLAKVKEQESQRFLKTMTHKLSNCFSLQYRPAFDQWVKNTQYETAMAKRVPDTFLKSNDQEHEFMEIDIKVVFQSSLHNDSDTPFINTLRNQVIPKSNSSTTKAAEEKGENEELSTVNRILMKYINEVKSSIEGKYSSETDHNLEMHIGLTLIEDFKQFLNENQSLLDNLQFIKKTDLIDGVTTEVEQYLTTQQDKLSSALEAQEQEEDVEDQLVSFSDVKKLMKEVNEAHEADMQRITTEYEEILSSLKSELSAKDAQINSLMQRIHSLQEKKSSSANTGAIAKLRTLATSSKSKT